jgi:glc operon protein GlcG
LASIKIATNKAFSSAREGKPSRAIGDAARNIERGFEMAYFGDRQSTGWAGGLPVIVEGECVGAVAVSGLTEDLDEEVAGAGVKAIRAF